MKIKNMCVTGSFVNNYGYNIPKKHLSEKQLKMIKDDLIVHPTSGFDNVDTEKVKFKVYSTDEKYITVPRYYGIKTFGKTKLKFNSEDVEMKFKGNMRDYQKDIVKTCLDHMNKH